MAEKVIIEIVGNNSGREPGVKRRRNVGTLRESWYYPLGEQLRHEKETDKIMEKIEKKIKEVEAYWEIKTAVGQEVGNGVMDFIFGTKKKDSLNRNTGHGIPGKLKEPFKIGNNYMLGILDLPITVWNIAKADDKQKETAVQIMEYTGSIAGTFLLGGVGGFLGSMIFSKWMEHGQYDKMKRNSVKFAKEHPYAPHNYYAVITKEEKRKMSKYNSTPYTKKEIEATMKRRKQVAGQMKKAGSDHMKKIERNSPTTKAKKTYTYKNSKSLAQYYRKKAEEERRERKKAMKKVLGAGKKAAKFIKSIVRFPFIKKHANGGFIYGKTLSYIGEEGPEAVIPLENNRRQRGIALWRQTGEKLGIPQKDRISESNKRLGTAVNLRKLLREQRETVSDELCSILADALEGAYKNMPLANGER